MKILQLITRQQRRGAEIFASQLSSALQSNGHEVEVLCLFDGNGDLPFEGEIKSLHADPNKRFFDWKSWKKLAEFIREFKPDIIQANASETLKFAVLSQLVLGWTNPIVYRNANQISGFLRNGLQKNWNKFLLNRVAGIASVSEASVNDLIQTFQLKSKPIRVIPIGIDSNEIDEKQKKGSNLLLPESFLIQIGGLVPEKDPLGMIPIFEKLSEDLPDLHLVLMGSGRLENEMIYNIEATDLAQRVHLIPNQQNIFPILGKAKALVMPSKIEGLPGVILEAMYCQIPVIAYGVGGIPEVLKSGETGWLIQPGDSDAFTQAILECLSLPDQARHKITKTAKKKVEEKYQIGRIAEEFEAFYKELLNL
ncbi:MAG: glycosyltransferase family 4 protein [Algoriphagus sp.]|nr:glycosyltransferase family 4 protein [Algoriphagus sp.]